MKIRKIILNVVLAAVIFSLGKSISACAEEAEDTVILQENAEEEDTQNAVQSKSALSITVDYPDQIKCGEPVTFTMHGDGGTGSYQYRIHTLSTYDGSERVPVYDVSYGSNSAYSESNEFTFTFYASGSYILRFNVMDKGSQPVQTAATNYFYIDIEDARYPSVEQLVNQVTSQCLKECTTEFEKVVWLHDWILDHADYAYSYSYSSAEGVLARGTGTCESYHRAYVMLLNKVGIQTGRITGNGHVWTAVRIDGEWYQVDSTWDDKGEKYKDTFQEHLYFGLTDYLMGLVHSDHKNAATGYESTALENNYFIKTGEIRQWSDTFVPVIKQNITDGKREFTISAPKNGMLGSYDWEIIYNLVAYQLSKQEWEGVTIAASYSNTDGVIIVKAEDAASCPKDIPITSVTLNKKNCTLNTGQSISLAAAIQPQNTTESKKLTWSSSNKAIAEVDSNGKVKGIKPGTATITVKSVNGKKASCSINVVNPGWKKDSVGYWYRNPNGTYPYNQWKKIDGAWYYFNLSGYRVTGWKMLGGTWYFMQRDGKMLTGAGTIGGKNYYFTSSGAMVKGWRQRNGSWYYYSSSGAMVKGAWQRIGNSWYYLKKDGKMAANEWIGGYYLNTSGRWI